MDLNELEKHVSIMLTQLRISFKKINVVRNVSLQFVIEDFGLIVCCINRIDYTQVNNVMNDKFEGWRIVYVTTNDSILDKKYDVLWALMRCGYMKWLRYKLPRQVKSILNGPDNLGQKIIEERLRVWADRPKYKFLIDDNKAALRNGVLREMTTDPSFFDYMPEEK